MLSNTTYSNEFVDCSWKTWPDQYPDLNTSVYNKVTDLWDIIISRYWDKSASFNKIISKISEIKAKDNVNEKQIQVLNLLWYYTVCNNSSLSDFIDKVWAEIESSDSSSSETYNNSVDDTDNSNDEQLENYISYNWAWIFDFKITWYEGCSIYRAEASWIPLNYSNWSFNVWSWASSSKRSVNWVFNESLWAHANFPDTYQDMYLSLLCYNDTYTKNWTNYIDHSESKFLLVSKKISTFSSSVPFTEFWNTAIPGIENYTPPVDEWNSTTSSSNNWNTSSNSVYQEALNILELVQKKWPNKDYSELEEFINSAEYKNDPEGYYFNSVENLTYDEIKEVPYLAFSAQALRRVYNDHFDENGSYYGWFDDFYFIWYGSEENKNYYSFARSYYKNIAMDRFENLDSIIFNKVYGVYKKIYDLNAIKEEKERKINNGKYAKLYKGAKISFYTRYLEYLAHVDNKTPEEILGDFSSTELGIYYEMEEFIEQHKIESTSIKSYSQRQSLIKKVKESYNLDELDNSSTTTVDKAQCKVYKGNSSIENYFRTEESCVEQCDDADETYTCKWWDNIFRQGVSLSDASCNDWEAKHEDGTCHKYDELVSGYDKYLPYAQQVFSYSMPWRTIQINRFYTNSKYWIQDADENAGINYWLNNHFKKGDYYTMSSTVISNNKLCNYYRNGSNCWDLSNSEYIDKLYYIFLFRASKEEGRNYWLDQLNTRDSSTARATVMRDIWNSTEAQLKFKNYTD